MVLPSKVFIGQFFLRKSFSREDKSFFGKKNYEDVVLNSSTNDQVIIKVWEEFRRW